MSLGPRHRAGVLRPPVAGALLSVLVLTSASAAEAATITGTVSWSKPRAPMPVAIARDHHVCGRAAPILDLDVDVDPRGRVMGAIVFIDGAPPKRDLAPLDVSLDQQNCRFVPRASAATVGSTLRVRSSDPVLHNVHVRDAAKKTVANYAMPVMGQQITIPLDATGELTITCDAGHVWMRAGLVVLDHELFTTSGAAGAYTLANVPPGTHRIVAWHPDLGRREATVVVAEGTSVPVRVDLAFGPLP